MPVDELMQAVFTMPRGTGGPGFMRFGPVLDPATIPQHPGDALAAGASAGIPLLIGTTRHENAMFLAYEPDARARRRRAAGAIGTDVRRAPRRGPRHVPARPSRCLGDRALSADHEHQPAAVVDPARRTQARGRHRAGLDVPAGVGEPGPRRLRPCQPRHVRAPDHGHVREHARDPVPRRARPRRADEQVLGDLRRAPATRTTTASRRGRRTRSTNGRP